ncbi:uncharacterized protein [Halyomorpha halys]|uniref:uncharacterized protein isoform X2 n=1 Tax=Halyomorpha halys TaxID=286706 RepID=UPI0006D4D32F|nr:uncharacterized protein LOC106678050 isoform X2 [Halyomorpha halys]
MFTCGSFLIFVTGFISTNGHPIDPKVVLAVSNGFGITIIGAALLITTVIALIACTCCKQRRDGFKEFRNPTTGGHIGFTNTLSELAIFPPPVTVQPQHPPSDDGSSEVNVHPPSRPAAFSCVVPSITDWFVDRNGNFPRQQLFYQKEIGKGWFGKVVKGEARGAKVVVRILREDATPEEKGYFLHEAKPFRDLKHKNISRLYGRCLEHDPFLLLFEYCTNGDLKSFLVTNSGSRNAITEQKISLKMMIDVTEGLKFMNEHGFIHTDLAARNCLVASDLTVKIGDYGTSVDKYQNEYYIVGDVAVPIRWCAPETLTCTQTTIETKEVTEGGNVWSLAVLLWEIAEFGKMPFLDLTDDEVITRVLVQGSVRLPPPNCSFGHYLHNVMTLCWRMENRANIEQILMMLMYLKNNPFQESDFESRWKALKPNTVVVVDNHTPIHSPRHTELAQRPHLTAKLEFDSGVDLEIKPTDENPDSCRTSTPNTVSPQLSVASEDIFQPVQHKSPSMTNLKGSLEDVTQFDSWLMGVEQKTEEDRNFVKNISEAIKNLDETLALEKTSSSSQDSSMEGSKKPLLEFKLGPTGNEKKGDSSSSDTEEETWRNRIERGEFTEKVKEKSKSVTDLMVLTHIDSEGSESDSLPSLTRQYSVKKTTVKGVSYTGIGFGSEGNIRNAVLSEELQDKLKQLTTWKTETQSFLVKGASEKNNKNLPFMGVEEVSAPIISMGDEDSSVPNSSSVSTTPIAAAEDVTGSHITTFSSDSASDVTAISNSLSEQSIVNIKTNPVNKETVMIEENNVYSDCIKGSLVNNEHSVSSNVRISENVGTNDHRQLVVDSKQTASSHSNKNSVPEIVITESEISQVLDEPEPSVDMQYVVDIKPRKFVFVCEETGLASDSSDDEKNSPQDVKTIIEPQQETSCSVILGSCEEHTLDYFKGLKTTFTPNVSYDGVIENQTEGSYDLLDEHSVKEESKILEKNLVDKKLPEVALVTLSDQAVINLSKDRDKNFEEEHISKRDIRENKPGVEDGEENVSQNNSMNFNESLLHIIDSFIDNERAYTALSIVPEKDLSLDISPNTKKLFPVEEVVEKSMWSDQENYTSPYGVESSYSYENSSEELLVDGPIDGKKLSEQVNVPSSPLKIENPFISDKSSEKHLVGPELVEKHLIGPEIDEKSFSTIESPFTSKNLIVENFVQNPLVENMFPTDLTSSFKTENPFISEPSSEECSVEVPVDENMFSNVLDLGIPFPSKNFTKEPLVESTIGESIFSKHANLGSPEKMENRFTSRRSSEEHLVDITFNECSSSDQLHLDLNNPSETDESSVSSRNSSKEHLFKASFDENTSNLQLSTSPEIDNLHTSRTSIEENLVDVTLNQHTFPNHVDLDNPFKMKIISSSENYTEETLIKTPNITSPDRIENLFTTANSSKEQLEDDFSRKNTLSKQTDLDSPFKMDNLVLSRHSSEEHLVSAPVHENKFSQKLELSSPCKTESDFRSEKSSVEHLVKALDDNKFSKMLELESTFISENSSEEHLESPTLNKKTFSKQTDLESPVKIENLISLGNSYKENLVEAPVEENKSSNESTLGKIENTLTSGNSSKENLVNPTLNKNTFSNQKDLNSPKEESLVLSGNISKEYLVEAPVDENKSSKMLELSSTCPITNTFTLENSSKEHLEDAKLNRHTFSKEIDVESPFKMENFISSENSSVEHLVKPPVGENKFSKMLELPSPCEIESTFISKNSSEEHHVDDAQLNKNTFSKQIDLNSPKVEILVPSGKSSEVEHKSLVEEPIDENKFSKKLEISIPCKIENTISSEEHFVEAPFPFNQPEPVDIHSNITSVKAKSLDSFLSPKNGYEHFVTLRNGLYVEDDSHITNFVPVFNMTESVSENAFMSQNLYYDPYFSVDSGHSSDRCIEQDKKMNDLKNRLEDVVKSGSDFQLKNSEEEYGGKLLTPDDERSSDSGFRDKGSLSESVEDTCDEKYNLEDIDAELDEFTLKNIDKEDLKYYEHLVDSDREPTPGWFLHVRPESTTVDAKESGWLSQSTEDEERLPLTIDAEFAAAIRNELKEKLPCAQQVEKTEEDASPEQEPATDKFTYPSQLSPILEEQESNQSSLQLNDCSPVFILPPPEIKTDTFKQDIVKAFESLESSKNGIIMEDLEDGNGLMLFSDDRIIVDDDVLIVDTETNEATLIESPKPQSHLAFILTKKEPEVFIDNDSPEVNSEIYVLTPDNAPLTPNSVNTDSHSSPENANMSGLFLSPCSIRSDLFDSGPPSLPFDLGQSLEEVEDIPVCEETVIENFTSRICNGDTSDHIMDNEKDILKGEEKEVDNNKIDVMEVELAKDSTNKLLEPLNTLKDHEENNKKSCGIEVTLDQSSPADSNLKRSLSDEKVSKHLRAEVEIDRLISWSNKENEIENTNHLNSNTTLRNDWLKDLFTNNINSAEMNSKEDKNHVNSNLRKTDWPTIEELVYEKRSEKSEQNHCLKPNITSTLALMSPDLSSADSKSLASSFSSTPSSDENKTVAMSTEDSDSSKSNEKLPKPNSLNLKSDASGAPMPSPEDAEKGWRPTICQLMELTDQAAADGEEMTTSFIEPDENGIYTPDWESDISEEQSSSSGEFVWKEGDTEDLLKCVGTDTNSLNDEIIGGGMERIEEEDEDCSSCNDSDTSSETSSGTEFVPSTWNAMAIPMKSALKVNTPQKKNEQKRVVFKKEKYQCIYEYPREESDNEEEEFSPVMWQTPTTPVFDYSVFADWELADGEIISTPIDSVDSDSEESKKPKKEEAEAEFDFYRLDYNPGLNPERPWSDSLPEDDADFSPLASDLAPVRLGDLRHTKATLRLELPQLRPDQGEASILDSVSDAPP